MRPFTVHPRRRAGLLATGPLRGAIVTIALLAGSTMAAAGEQAERAIAAVKALVERGEVRADSVIRLRAKQGNMVSFLGRDFELQREWERRTGIVIDASVMPQLDSLELIRAATDIDLTIARNHEYADLAEARLIEDLTPLLKRFGFAFGGDGDAGYLLPRHQAQVGEQVVAIPADFDAAYLFLRRDLLEDPAQRQRFRERHGRELGAPRTWAEYLQLLEFFHRPRDGFYASAEPREKLTGWMYWLPRYLSGAAPVQPLFDERMRPLIDGPAGIAATEHYAATVAFSPPQVLEDGKDYSYTLPFFIRGQAFATVLTLATAKISNREESAVRGKFVAVPMPGWRVGDRLVRRTQIIYGNNLVVPAKAPNKLLGFLFAMWLTDPDNATRSVAANGIADPYRRSSFRDERVKTLYTPQALQLALDELPIVAPSGTGLPGDAQYLAALNEHLWLAARGQLSAKEAMARTAAAWEAITDRLGRAKQVARWQAVRRLYPTATEPAR